MESGDAGLRSGATRQETRRWRSGWRSRAREHEAGWDLRLCLIVGGALVVSFLLPVDYVRHWPRSGEFVHLWERLDGAASMAAFVMLLPMLFGVSALIHMGIRQPKARGVGLLLGGLTVLALPLLLAEPRYFGLSERALRSALGVALVMSVAPPIVAGANRIQGRAGPIGLCQMLVGLGGLAILISLFWPLGDGDSYRSVAGAMFGFGASWSVISQLWPLVAWFLVVLMYGAVAAVHLVPALPAPRIAPWLSMAGRFALLGLPVAVLLMILWTGTFEVQGGFLATLLVLGGTLIPLLGTMVLTAAGLALVVDPRPEVERERRVGRAAREALRPRPGERHHRVVLPRPEEPSECAIEPTAPTAPTAPIAAVPPAAPVAEPPPTPPPVGATPPGGVNPALLDRLKTRLVEGEIDIEEYRALKAALED